MNLKSPTEWQVSPAAQKALQGRWWRLLPAVFVTYSLAYLDRANYGMGAAAGLAATLHISGEQNSLLGALFFLGYFLFQVPGMMLFGKRSPVRLIFISMVIWGILAALTGVMRSFWMLALARFLLGVAESCIFPAMILLLTRWFTRAERSRANALLIMANAATVLWMSLITGFLMDKLGWQTTFIVEGLPAVLWALCWTWLVHDRAAETKWMTAEAAEALEMRLDNENATGGRVESVRAVLLRGDILLLAAVYFCWSLGIYGFVLWLPTIVRRGAGSSMSTTGIYSAIPYLAAILLMLFAAHRSDKLLKRKALVWPFLLIAGVALMESFLSAGASFPIPFAGLIVAGACMYAPYGPFFALIAESVPKTAVAETLALINSSGALGAFVGTYCVGWLQAVTRSSRPGFLLMAGSAICAAVTMLLLKEKPVEKAV
jgi:sugar phosphate permease